MLTRDDSDATIFFFSRLLNTRSSTASFFGRKTTIFFYLNRRDSLKPNIAEKVSFDSFLETFLRSISIPGP